jgi:hypothetical protein
LIVNKICRECRTDKPGEEFFRCASAKDGLQSRCKPCGNAKSVAWRQANRQKARAIDKASRVRCPLKRKARQRRSYLNNANKRREAARVYIRVLKDAAYAAYGGYQCQCCGETERAFLSIDHVNNDGHAHRKTFRGVIYGWLKKNGYPPGFQILCMNCNFGKKHNGGICPHRARKPEPFLFVG